MISLSGAAIRALLECGPGGTPGEEVIRQINLNTYNINGKEDYLGKPSSDGWFLASTSGGIRYWSEIASTGAIWGQITGDITRQDDLQNQFDEHFLKSEHIEQSTGAPDAFKPVLLGSTGKLDPSFYDFQGFTYIADWTPTAGNEYPDPTGFDPGSFWTIIGVDDVNGYTFTGGDLAGETAYNGDYLLLGSARWGLLRSSIDPNVYYKLDGTNPITGPFAGGGQQFKNAAEGSDPNDLVTLSQLSEKITDPGTPSNDGEVLHKNIDGTIYWSLLNTGSMTFIGLDDTPDDYASYAGNLPVVNTSEDGLVFMEPEWVKRSGDSMTGRLIVEKDGESILLTSSIANYIRGHAIDGTNGWFVGRGLNGSNNISLHNYKGSYIDLPEGGGAIIDGFTIWHSGNDGDGSGLEADTLDGLHLTELPDAPVFTNVYFQENEFITTSTGSGDAAKPVKTSSTGQLDLSLIPIDSGLEYQGSFTPVDGAEYPDTTGLDPGAFWDIESVPEEGYVFADDTGDLYGETIYNGDYMLFGNSSWGIVRGKIDPSLYYRLDGAFAITANFQAGGFKLVNVANGTEDTDVATYGQVRLKENSLGNPSNDGYVLSSTTAGVRSWIPMNPGGASDFLGLSDTPDTYSGSGGQILYIPATEDRVGFHDPIWVERSGDSMTGTLGINKAGECIHFSATLANYIRGVAVDGTNGWFVGRGLNGSDNISLHNYKGSYIDLPEGGGAVIDGFTIWHAGNDGSLSGLDADLLDGVQLTDLPNDPSFTGMYYTQSSFIDETNGGTDAGKPVKTNVHGLIDPSFLNLSGGLNYVGGWTPTPEYEYPTPPNGPGDYWSIEGVDDDVGYTFASGDLIGRTVRNGDFILMGSSKWGIVRSRLDPSDYYRLDGTVAITAPFAGGGQRYTGMADPVDDTDGVNRRTLDTGLSGKENQYPVPTEDKMIMAYFTDGSRQFVSFPTSSPAAVLDTFLGDGLQTSFSTSVEFDTNTVLVLFNGVKLQNNVDVDVSSGISVVFDVPPDENDLIEVYMHDIGGTTYLELVQRVEELEQRISQMENQDE